jgi:osmoprotectant transport system substrate-binding protein
LKKLLNLRLVSCLVVLLLVSLLIGGCGKTESVDEVRIGSQTYSEPIILGEMVKALIEEGTDLKVTHTPQLSSSLVVQQAMVNKEIDISPRYTGTELTGALRVEERMTDPEQVYNLVKDEFAKQFGQTWFKPLGFNNTYALTVRRDVAEQFNLKTISDLKSHAKDMIIGTDTSFADRTGDGLEALKEMYGLQFKQVFPMEIGLVYEAVASKKCDIVVAYSTDARIKSFDLVTLEDDLKFFPPYDCALVARTEVLEKHPELKEILAKLEGQIDVETMVGLNYLVDEQNESPEKVARDFLRQKGLIK